MESYLKDPEAIYARSFAIVREQAVLAGVPAELEPVAVRLVHACGMPDILDDLEASTGFVGQASSAIAAGAPLLCDCEMVASGITRRFLADTTDVIVTLNDPQVPALAARLATTRSAAAVELWRERMEGAVVVVGNAPTALFRCLEIIAEGGPRPAAVIGCPVGFVGAAESKAALAQCRQDIPFLVVHGTRGGSAMASSVVNALALACDGTTGS
ncbi:MAG: precorrin-8X methylmutase [Candidatus Puniceispirillaceae bacterium]